MNPVTPADVAKLITEARVSDSLKKQLIIRLAKARTEMNDYEFAELFAQVKEKLAEKERMLN